MMKRSDRQLAVLKRFYDLRAKEAREHTPGPWTTRIGQPGTMLEVCNQKGEYVCSLLGGDEHKQADAAFIVQACNSHAALVDALEKVLGALNHGTENPHWEHIDRVRAALTLAGKQSDGQKGECMECGDPTNDEVCQRCKRCKRNDMRI